MPKLSKILWLITILFIAISTLIFSFGIVLVGAVMLSLYGIYRHYFPKKRRYTITRNRSQMYTFGEVIDLKPEVMYEKIEAKIIDK